MKRTTNYILWIAILAAIPLLMMFLYSSAPEPSQFTQTQFLEQLRGSNIVKGTIVYDTRSPFLRTIRGDYLTMRSGHRVEKPFTTLVRLTDRLEEEVLRTGLFEIKHPNTFLQKYVPFLAD